MKQTTIVVLTVALHAMAPALAKEMIPYEQFTLANGLKVIVHEDHKAPIVAVRVAYHVGAKDEPDGRTGFAHLFEHLMFKGSENFNGDFFHTLDNVGASDTNGVTTQDTTIFHETVPTPALELVLWLESDRMGHLLGNITQGMLDSERGVVQNEKHQREGGPLGGAHERIMRGLFPVGHPYRRSVAGSMEDLNAASVEDVQDWFHRYYGAANTTVVLAGDIDVPAARTLMEKYFGDVPAGEPVHRMEAWIPERTLNARETLEARVAQKSIQRFWAVPPPDSEQYTLLGIAADVLSGDLKSRLRGELVEKRKLASGASASIEAMEIAGIFSIGVDLKAGADPAAVERVIDEQLALFLEKGPTRKELDNVKSDLEAFQLGGLQSVSTKAAILASAALYTGDPGFNERGMEWTRQATREDVLRVAKQWLTKGYYQLTIDPFGEYTTVAAKFDRSVMPEVVDDLEVDLPPIQEAVLSNGIRLVLAERHEVPALSMTMVLANAGSSADRGGKTGTAGTTFTLMSNGPAELSRADYAERLQELHIGIGMVSGGRDATSSLSTFKKNLPQALQLWGQVLRKPAFRPQDLRTWRENALTSIESSRTDAAAIGSRILATAIYPAGHPFAPHWNGVELVKAIELEDLRKFHATWIRPDIVKLFVVGDTTLPEIVQELEKVFAGWQAPAEPPPVIPPIAAVPIPDRPRFLLVDWPGEQRQTQITAGRLVLPADSDDSRKLNAANAFLGGGTTARLGQRLRVEKGWSYGIASGTDGGLIQQFWGLSAPVQTDKTVEAVVEILDVIRAFTGPEPGTPEELARFVKGQSQSLPGMFEAADSILGAMVQSDAYGRPYDWIEGAKARLNALELDEVNRVAREYITPESFTWVLVGDLAKFEQKLRDLQIGDVEVWDAEGHRIR